MPSSSTLYQICNGVELESANSRPERFTFDNFSINLKDSQGSVGATGGTRPRRAGLIVTRSMTVSDNNSNRKRRLG